MHILEFKSDHTNDTMSKGTDSTNSKTLTQRFVINFVSKACDPIGLVAPFNVGVPLVSKKHLAWQRTKLGIMGFLACCVKLPQLAKIHILRSFFGNVPISELHMFGDSSQDVFSVVVFRK